jgi:hypothetical protein
MSLKNKKKFGFAVCELKTMGGKGVIVYGNFINIILTTFKNSSVYGRPKKVIPLSSPHRARPCPSTLPIQGKKLVTL